MFGRNCKIPRLPIIIHFIAQSDIRKVGVTEEGKKLKYQKQAFPCDQSKVKYIIVVYKIEIHQGLSLMKNAKLLQQEIEREANVSVWK